MVLKLRNFLVDLPVVVQKAQFKPEWQVDNGPKLMLTGKVEAEYR